MTTEDMMALFKFATWQNSTHGKLVLGSNLQQASTEHLTYEATCTSTAKGTKKDAGLHLSGGAARHLMVLL